MSLIGETFVNGILLGGVFALSAAGFSLIFGVMDILNLTHGAVVILSAFLSYFGLELYGIDPFVSIVPLMVAMFVAGYAFQRLVIVRILNAEVLVTLLVTFGVALMIRNILELTVTATPRSISPPYASQALQTGVFGPISFDRLGALVVSLVLFAVLTWFLGSTDYGRQIRATAENPQVAELCGIDTNHIYGITFGVGTALAASAGVLVGLTTTFQPIDEGTWNMYAFVVVILGGFGKPAGALLGGLLLGLAWSFTTVYLGTQFAALVAFGMLVVMLIVRPQGILGGWEN